MESLKRVRFFTGQLLTAEDLSAEQSYHLRKQQLRNLAVLGSGIVSGLQVTAQAAGFRVAPGMAVDGLGREIFLPEAEVVPVSPSLQSGLVVISYRETPVDPSPLPNWDQTEYTRIEEGSVIEVVPRGPIKRESVVLGAFERTAHGWVSASRRGEGVGMVLAALAVGFMLSWGVRRGR